MGKSTSVTFRIPAELADSFAADVEASGMDKTSWLVDAMRLKLGRPVAGVENRLYELVDRMEVAAAALIGGKQGIPPKQYDEAEVIKIVVNTIKQGLDNGRIIAERINNAGYQTKAGRAWDKDIYSAWKRMNGASDRLAEALAQQ
ncbi:hypothetical protein QTO20_18520 [Serratia marcescens]|uniref:hypothetical protein n=1 Tax=Serratia marcescens TaxID=615 RepID=UPI0038969D94